MLAGSWPSVLGLNLRVVGVVVSALESQDQWDLVHWWRDYEGPWWSPRGPEVTDEEIRTLRFGQLTVGDLAGVDLCNIALGVPGTPRPGLMQYMTQEEARRILARFLAKRRADGTPK